eukprot:1190459-Prorocentrum_minimum.AAC.1
MGTSHNNGRLRRPQPVRSRDRESTRDESQSHQGRGNLPETRASRIKGGEIYPRREPVASRERESTRDECQSHQGRGNLPETSASRIKGGAIYPAVSKPCQ